MILLAGSKGPDQTARMRRLIWAFAVRIGPKTRFCMLINVYIWHTKFSTIYAKNGDTTLTVQKSTLYQSHQTYKLDRCLWLHCTHTWRFYRCAKLEINGPLKPVQRLIPQNITKTYLFKYTENFTTKKTESFQIKILIFFIFLLKT